MLNRYIAAAALAGAANAIDLKLLTEAKQGVLPYKWSLNDVHWTEDSKFTREQMEHYAQTGEQFTDMDFSPSHETLGFEPGHAMYDQYAWKRISEIFPEGYMFHEAAEGEEVVMSTADQGSFSNSSFMAVVASIDARPHAMEALFVTSRFNKAGIYAMNLAYAGQRVVVHVDDYIPVMGAERFGRVGWFPAFAASTVDGEVWPMVAEKVWAKVSGSYALTTRGGLVPAQILSHMTNDPTLQLNAHATSKYYRPENAWSKLKSFAKKEYLTILGTKDTTEFLQPNHTYSIYNAFYIKGGIGRIVRLRSPWAADHDKYQGKFGYDTPEYQELAEYMKGNDMPNNVNEPGMFYANWD